MVVQNVIFEHPSHSLPAFNMREAPGFPFGTQRRIHVTSVLWLAIAIAPNSFTNHLAQPEKAKLVWFFEAELTSRVVRVFVPL